MKKFYFLFVFSLFLLLLSQSTSFSQVSSSGKELTSVQKIQDEEQFYSGSIWGWGRNDLSQLGDGTAIDQYGPPIQIGNDTTWKIIASGRDHSAGIKTDGTLWVCGNNFYGELGTGTTDASSTFVQIGTENNWKYVVTGTVFTLAMKNDGSLWGWGNNAWGVFGDSTFKGSLSPVKAAKILWGNIKYLCTGGSNCAAITNDGSLWMWGSNGWSTLGDGTNRDKCYPVKVESTGEWLTVACSGLSTVAIKKDGTLWRWGCNYDGYLREGAVAYNNQPKKYGTETNWAAVSVGQDGALALKKDGTLWAWGVNHYGAVGDGTTDVRNTPVQIGTDNDWDIISTSWGTSFATKKDGSLWSWGLQSSVENPNKYFLVPTRIENMEDIIQISNNEYHTAMFIQGQLPKIPKIPEVVTLPITKITTNSAESGGNVLFDDDEEVIRGICFSTSSNPTINDTKTIDGKGLGVFQSAMNGLAPYTKYYVRAYATNIAGTAYGQEESFNTKMAAPLLISPINNAHNVLQNGTLVWKNLQESQKYCVQLSENDKFLLPNLNEFTNLTSLNYKNLKRNIQYNWRVKAINGLDSSEWSEIWSFTTTKFNPQELSLPVNDTINVPIDCQLIWKQNTLTSKYLLQVSKNENFADLAIDSITTATFLKCDGLDFLGSYYWRVSAVDEEDSSEWSPVWHFVTLMDSINLIAPSHSANGLECNTDMNWEKGIYGRNYRFQISKFEDFKIKYADLLISTNNVNNIKNLDYWQKYFWRVRNESGDTLGYWSTIWQFKTRMSDMLLIYPKDTQTGLDTKINFKWLEVIGGKYYQLQISKNELFTDIVYSRDSIQKTSQYVPDLEPDILYYWRVRVWNTETIGTAYWSEVWTFRTGTSDVKEDSEIIEIIPNPAGEYITVTLERCATLSKCGTSGEIQIYNTLGEKVMSVEQTFLSVQQISISALPKGMYFVKVGGETAKFVKM